MVTRVSDMSVEELRELIQETVTEVLVEMVRDPDMGLALREDFRDSLQRSLQTPDSERETLGAEKVAEKLGLSW